jgi:DNA-3-methyladenine glycosylase II
VNPARLKTAYEILNLDPILKTVIAQTGPLRLPPKREIYSSLLQSIVYQQLSTKAADTIWNRFLDLFPERNPGHAGLLRCDATFLRQAGISTQKANYLINIAQAAMQGMFHPKILSEMDDESLINHLSTIKGVGRWTAQMSLLFSLGRPDVFPAEDLGIRSAIVQLYELTCNGKHLTNRITEISENWKPYRSLATLHLWKFRDSTK